MTSTTLTPAAAQATPNPVPAELAIAKVVVGTDFSAQAQQALDDAILISRSFHAHLVLVSAARPFVSETMAQGVSTELLNLGLDLAKAEMDSVVKQNAELVALNPGVVVAYADPVELIVEVAKQQQADLIVVGSEGASGLKRLALGSVAESVLSRASCPVLVSGPGCGPQPELFRSIVLATDLTPTSLRAAKYAAALADRFASELTVVHVIDPATIPAPLAPEPEFIDNALERRMRQLLPARTQHIRRLCFRTEYREPAASICNVVREVGATMVVLGLGNRGLLADHAPWSTLAQVIRDAKCPVLGVQAPAHPRQTPA